MRILVLEDAKSTQLLIRKRLEKEGHSVEVVDNGHQGFLLASSAIFDIILTDISMPFWDGFKFIEAIGVVSPHLPIVILSSRSEELDVRRRLRKYKTIVGILPKPFDFDTLFSILKSVRVQTHHTINKKSRIVCTLGPASSDPEVLGRMILAGMDVARLNFSHGTYEDHEAVLATLRNAEAQWEKPVAVLQDLCGPKIRTGMMKNGGAELISGERLIIQAESIEGTAQCISTITPEILQDLRKDDPVLLDDGLLELMVVEEGKDKVLCEVVVGGLLKSGKGINLPATSLSLPSITEKDWRDLDWGLDHSIDYVALSFVRSPEEILTIKDYIKKSGKRDIRVIAKIEKPEAVRDIREIISVSDGIMVARGDMGVELPAARVPRIQQEIIKLCWQYNKPVITATQMLDSMTAFSRPTRAEVTDVSVAIKEGTDAVMLSQETATGTNPVNVVRTMAEIICEEERYSGMSVEEYKQLMDDSSANPVITAAASLRNAAAVMLFDPEGKLYPVLSKWNRTIISLLITRSMHVARRASLYKNIIPLVIREELDRDHMLEKAMETAKKSGYIRQEDTVAVLYGEGVAGRNITRIGALQLVKV
jgi:pyruvate kinase